MLSQVSNSCLFHFNFLFFSLCLYSLLYPVLCYTCSTPCFIWSRMAFLFCPLKTLKYLHDLRASSSPISFGKCLILPAFINLLHLWTPAVLTTSTTLFLTFPLYCVLLFSRCQSSFHSYIIGTWNSNALYYIIIPWMSCSFSEHEVDMK